jgi:hypothetical protein
MIGMEISNKTLAWLVIAAIVVSVFGTTLSLQRLNKTSLASGYASSNATGTASVDVSQSVVLRYAVNAVNFGSGAINSSGGFNNCILSINDTVNIGKVGCEGFNTTNSGGPFIIENAGTSFLNVTLNFSKNATAFIGGNATLTWFKYAVSNNESSSCISGLASTAWTEVVENSSVPICTNMSWLDPTDSLRIGINISIPNNAVAGAKSVSIIAQGTGI